MRSSQHDRFRWEAFLRPAAMLRHFVLSLLLCGLSVSAAAVGLAIAPKEYRATARVWLAKPPAMGGMYSGPSMLFEEFDATAGIDERLIAVERLAEVIRKSGKLEIWSRSTTLLEGLLTSIGLDDGLVLADSNQEIARRLSKQIEVVVDGQEVAIDVRWPSALGAYWVADQLTSMIVEDVVARDGGMISDALSILEKRQQSAIPPMGGSDEMPWVSALQTLDTASGVLGTVHRQLLEVEREQHWRIERARGHKLAVDKAAQLSVIVTAPPSIPEKHDAPVAAQVVLTALLGGLLLSLLTATALQTSGGRIVHVGQLAAAGIDVLGVVSAHKLSSVGKDE